MTKKIEYNKIEKAAEIKKLYAEGLFVKDILKIIKISQSSFYKVCEEYNIISPLKVIWRDETAFEEIKKLINLGFGYKAIVKKTGITISVIKTICKKNNLKTKNKAPKILPPITDKTIMNEIKSLFIGGLSQEKISKKLGISRPSVKIVLDTLNVKTSLHILKQSNYLLLEEKKCKNCDQIKDINCFLFIKSKKRYESNCKLCIAERNRLWLESEAGQEYKEKNKEKQNELYRIKYASDAHFKLRKRLSWQIRNGLSLHGGSKNGDSIMNNLPYTINDLYYHIELLFEPWMTWENWASYEPKTWDDNDQSTWVWNLDHIIPQSEFYYTSMEDLEFQECWAMSNLRPYSAKQNLIDGSTKIRHNKT